MAGPTETEQASIEKYLSKFSRCLSPLPRIERDEIVRETRSHLLDAVSAGAPASAATVALGDPASYARRFVENYRIDVALASGSTTKMLLTAGSLISRGVIAFVGFHVLLLLFLMAIGLLAMAVVKPFAPEYVGLWISPTDFTFGLIRSPDPTSVERLGWWIVPLCLFGGGLLVMTTRRLLSSFLKLLNNNE